jgi:hypothetical protein
MPFCCQRYLAVESKKVFARQFKVGLPKQPNLPSIPFIDVFGLCKAALLASQGIAEFVVTSQWI